ncbi:cyclin-dependent kinase 11A-like isoform X1 [Trichogramma pretiosum]|uniref:cyclin-dependent kinase 11A-like isoform X1 n=1 Tax=Trichogramma pretiosum TaxID=7493 RepID=UPI0006C9786F|nr:cyclin-dependent kinase 11A-like isoform X1 [Trichogramma pretiosum]
MNDEKAMEEGELRRSPYSEEEGADTADSLEIKPPQAVVRHRKIISNHHDKYLERSAQRKDEKDRNQYRNYTSKDESRYREQYSHSNRHHRSLDFTEAIEKQVSRRSDPSKREREFSRTERKDHSTGDRVLEDLRESNFGHTDSNTNLSRVTNRLLDKREKREKRDEYRLEVSSSSRSRDELRLSSGSTDRREMERRELKMIAAMEKAVANARDRREVRLIEERSSRHIRLPEHDMSYQQHLEIMDEAERYPVQEKRHKRSHKHERIRSRDEEKKHRHGTGEKHSREHRHQQVPEASLYEDLDRMEVMISKQHIAMKDPKDMNEQELRRHRLIEAEREMARRKESSRLELEARRIKRGEKRKHDDVSSSMDPSVVELSDENLHSPDSNMSNPKSHNSAASDQESGNNSDGDSTDSSSSSSSDEDDSDASKHSNEDSNSDYNLSPVSQIQLAKSDASNNESSSEHVDTNGTSKEPENDTEKSEMDLMLELPAYLPAIQGCRSVEEYKCLNRIAEGTYGVVYRAEDRRTKEIVALKRLKMEKEKDGFPITSLREINTLLKAQHPNIVTVREIVVGSNMDKIFIVMDYVEHDLKSLIETMKSKNQVFIPGEVKCLMQQLLQAVSHMHDNWILHRDLKTSNLLLSHRGILKVGDFGLAREYGSPLKQYTSIVVTLWYRAPELLLGSKTYSTPIDLWSVGCIFAELLRMEALFPGKSELDLLNRVFKELGTPNDRIWPGYSKLPMTKKVSFSQYPVNNIRQRFNLLTDLGIDLLNKFLTYDPEQRISAEDALKHGYFIESPVAIDPSMFPTWPAKSEFGARTINQSPKPPSGGKEFKQKGYKEDEEDNVSGFHMGGRAATRQAVGGGFHLKF